MANVLANWSDDQIEAVRRLIVDEKKSVTEVSDHLAIEKASVVYIMDKLGIQSAHSKRRVVHLGTPTKQTRYWTNPEPAMSSFKTCQWIEGDARSRNFCGRRTVFNSSWCSEHIGNIYGSFGRDTR